MIKLTENSYVYVVCPAYKKTGGTELAHQLVYELNILGVNAYITYYSCDKGNTEYTDKSFKQYVKSCKLVDDIKDNSNNLVIVPEININLLDTFTSIKKAIWWMSVDNFTKNNGINNAIKFYGFFNACKLAIKRNINILPKKIPNGVQHFYQSAYAREFLISQGIDKTYRLSDYINEIYIENRKNIDRSKKKNIVLYNPKKGLSFTERIKDASKNLKWVPIENLTNYEVSQLLKKSKVYIDFGNHPGKDRFPREAAMSDCCIITGKKGSAKYYEDISIPDKYKFQDKVDNIGEIVSCIESCLDDYNTKINDFSKYREKITEERNLFKNDIKKIFFVN